MHGSGAVAHSEGWLYHFTRHLQDHTSADARGCFNAAPPAKLDAFEHAHRPKNLKANDALYNKLPDFHGYIANCHSLALPAEVLWANLARPQ